MIDLFLLFCSGLTLLGGSYAEEPGELPACCANGTLGVYDPIECNVTYPSPGFNLWPNHHIRPDASISCTKHNRLEDFNIKTDGTLVYWVYGTDLCTGGHPVEYHRSDYCLDYDVTKNKTVAHVCYKKRPEVTIHLTQKICSVFSAGFLIITIVIYTFNKSAKWSNGAFFICQSMSLTIAFIWLARIQFFPPGDECSQCLVAGYCLQYFFLAAFFWMNTHCFNIYMNTSRLIPSYGSRVHDEMRKKRFLWASLYAWGTPFVITLVTFAMQNFVPATLWVFRPDIGNDMCCLSGWIVKWIYFYGPMAIIIVVNIVLFMLTFTILVKHKINIANVRTNQSKLQREQWYQKQFFKLFIVTGLSWAGEVLGYTFREDGDLENWRDYLWLMLDIFNSLQGLFIFMIFVCPKESRRHFRRLPGYTGTQESNISISRRLEGSTRTTKLSVAKFSKSQQEATLMPSDQETKELVDK